MIQTLISKGYTHFEDNGVIVLVNGNNHVEIFGKEVTFYQDNKIVKQENQ